MDGTQGFFKYVNTPANKNNNFISPDFSLLQPLSAEDDERVFSRFGRSLSLACYSLIREMALRIHSLSCPDINVPYILTRLLTFMFLAITIFFTLNLISFSIFQTLLAQEPLSKYLLHFSLN